MIDRFFLGFVSLASYTSRKRLPPIIPAGVAQSVERVRSPTTSILENFANEVHRWLLNKDNLKVEGSSPSFGYSYASDVQG